MNSLPVRNGFWAGVWRSRSGFSLIEVILSLGIVVVVLLPVLGLLGVGLHSVQDSDMKLEAANVASAILNKRLAAPAATGVSPLPPIDSADVANTKPPTTGTTISNIDSGGDISAGANDPARFNLTYRIWQDTQTFTTTTSANAKVIRIDMLITWPSTANPASFNPAASPNQYELLTSALVTP